jgi:hypothetical protein
MVNRERCSIPFLFRFWARDRRKLKGEKKCSFLWTIRMDKRPNVYRRLSTSIVWEEHGSGEGVRKRQGAAIGCAKKKGKRLLAILAIISTTITSGLKSGELSGHGWKCLRDHSTCHR